MTARGALRKKPILRPAPGMVYNTHKKGGGSAVKKSGTVCAALLLLALVSCTPTPVPTVPPSPTPDPYANEYAQVDLSLLDRGVIRVRYTGGGETRVKVQITREGGQDYNYDLADDGDWESFTLTEGEGAYTLRVLENQSEDRYKPVFDCALSLKLSDPAAPFLQSNQFVSFTADSAAAALAAQLTGELETEEEKIGAVFDYVVDTLTYDPERAAAVEPGYLPDLDDILERGKGICFDYAALMTAMLRSQGVACKLAVGWAGKEYHAWVEVPDGTGGWRHMDPTFFSGGREDPKIQAFISDSGNYTVRYYY